MRRFNERYNVDHLDELYDREFDMLGAFFDDALESLIPIARRYNRKSYINVNELIDDNMDLIASELKKYVI